MVIRVFFPQITLNRLIKPFCFQRILRNLLANFENAY